MKVTLGLLVAVLLAASSLLAQDCCNYEIHNPIGNSSDGSRGLAVVLAGSYAFVSYANEETSGLNVIDITIPESPQIVGSTITTNEISSVAILGEYIYAADGWGVQVIDISNPFAPSVVAGVETPSSTNRLVADEAYLYVASDSGLYVVDVSVPTSPQVVASIATSSELWDVAVDGGFAYVAWGSDPSFVGGLDVIDISSPESPFVELSLPLDYNANRITIGGGYAYVACGIGWVVGIGELLIFDLSDPPNSLSDPTALVVDHWGVNGVTSVAYSEVGDIVVLQTESAYPNHGHHTAIIDVSVPTAPVDIGHVEGWGREMVISGNLTWVADESGFSVYDLSLLPWYHYVGSVEIGGLRGGIAVTGDLAYLAAGDTGLTAVRISDPGSPIVVGGLDTPGSARDIAVSGGLAYVADGDAGLQVIDITQIEDLHIEGNVSTLDEARAIAIQDNYAYIADYESGLVVIDISNPAIPQLVGNAETPTEAMDVAVQGGYAFVVDNYLGLQIINIADPGIPEIVGSVDPIPSSNYSVAVSGSYAYVAKNSRLEVIDITNPEAPEIVGTVSTPGSAYSVAVLDNYAYVGGGYQMSVIDISDPADPQLVGPLEMSGIAGIAVVDQYVLLADQTGLVIAPLQCDDAVSIEGESGSSSGEDETQRPRLHLAVHPNPFNPQTTVSFSLDRATWVAVSVYDLTGHLVTTLASQPFNAGHHTLKWAGNDSRGRAVPSGTYIVRVETEERVQARKVMLVR